MTVLSCLHTYVFCRKYSDLLVEISDDEDDEELNAAIAASLKEITPR
jgi:hypothetical protein